MRTGYPIPARTAAEYGFAQLRDATFVRNGADWFKSFDKSDKGRLYRVHDAATDGSERVLETRTDAASGQSWQRVKFQPSIIAYTVGKTRYEKAPDAADLTTLTKIEALSLPASVPTSSADHAGPPPSPSSRDRV